MRRYRQYANPPLDGKPLPASMVTSQVDDRPQGFAADIFVPLLQNVLGGLATAGLCAILSLAVATWLSADLDLVAMSFWCLLLGGAVTCLATVVRFFGDDVGLLHLAYKRGQDSQRLRINALELELNAAQDQVKALVKQTRSIPSSEATYQMERIFKAAKHLIHWHFEKLPIDRRSCEARNMAQSEWRKARHLLITAGVMDEQGITAETLPEALNQASAHYQRLIAHGAGATGKVSPV
jgi:hypothetical protein